MFLKGMYDENWRVINFGTIYAYAAVTGHRDCSGIFPLQNDAASISLL